MTEEKKMLFSQDALKKLLWPLIIEQFLAIAIKEGKKRMRQVGNVEIPQKAFMSVLKLDED